MNEVTLPPSPNWYQSNIVSCTKNGTVAWGSRHTLVIGQPKEDSKSLEYSIILNAHKDRVTSVVFSPEFGSLENRLLASTGDDHVVKIWDVDNATAALTNSVLDDKKKVVGVDWSKNDPKLLCYVSSEGILVSWNISFDTHRIITPAKLTATCITCCPHEPNLVAVGSKKGQVFVINIQGSGSINYILRGHDVEVVSLSWCPVSTNVFLENGARDLLLASGGKDKSIFFWKAGGDGRYQSQITLPPYPMSSQGHRSKLGGGSFNWTTVCWAESKLVLMSSSFGELLSWDLKTNSNNKPTYHQIHDCHKRGLFGIATHIQVEDMNEQNWREKQARKIWTVGQDRKVISCEVLEDSIKIGHQITTQGGFVYCIAACPLDMSQIAFGAGDAMLRIWNLSEPHEFSFYITTVWQKVMGKVRAISWHPEKENLIAYGTEEGRIGVYDTNAMKPPLLYRQYHRKTIYSLHWGPAPDIELYALYSCGDGELVYYNLEKPDQEPKSVIKKECTEFAWKPNYKIMAVGFEYGKISFFDKNFKEYKGAIFNTMRTAVHCLVWHPESTATDLNISPLENYLAVAFNTSEITIFDVSDLEMNEAVGDDKLVDANEPMAFYRTVATLAGHTERVVSLAWSPHQSGYLISGSYDNTVQVWRVTSQELIGTYTGHIAPVFCCMWSPLDADFVISGSGDFTVQIWKISDQEPIMPTEKPPSKKIRTKKKKSQLVKSSKSNESVEEVLKTTQSDSPIIVFEKKSVVKKESRKKMTYFPAYTKSLNNKAAILSSVKTLLSQLKVENDTEKKEDNGENDVEIKEDEMENVPSIFAGKESVSEIIKKEKSLLHSQGQYNAALELDVWNNNLLQNLQDAVKEKRLTDYLVSLAPSLSMKTWQEICEAYAMQLLSDGHINKAVCYLLRIHKIHRAVSTFSDEKMYREAYALATLKLDPEDPMLENILRDWANNATKEGNFEDAVQCYLKLKDFTKAAQLLARRKNVHFLDLASELAETGDDLQLRDSLAEQAITEALLNSDFNTAKVLIEKHSRLKHYKIVVSAYEEIKNSLENCDSRSIHLWLEGKSTIGILDHLKKLYEDSGLYSEIAKLAFNAPLKTEAELWMSVSYQLSMAVVSEDENQLLKHILSALEIISTYLKVQTNAVESLNLIFIKFLSILDVKSPLNEESMFFGDSEKAKAMRAYLGYGLLFWILEENLNKPNTLENEETLDPLFDMINKYIKDVFDKETFKHWTAMNEISKLEYSLAMSIGKSQTSEDEKLDSALSVERLDQLRFGRKQFVENRISAPNPMDAYAKSLDLISKNPDGYTESKIRKLIDEAWTLALII